MANSQTYSVKGSRNSTYTIELVVTEDSVDIASNSSVVSWNFVLKSTTYYFSAIGMTAIVNLDGDDVFVDKNFIIDAINLFKVFNEEPVCLIASRQRNDAIKTKHNIETEYLRISGIDYVTNIQDKYIFSHLTTIYDRKLAKNLNFYSKNIISSDMESILRLALTGDVIVTQRVAGQWNRTKNNASRNAELLESLENHIWIDSVYEELKKLISIKEHTNWKSRVEIKWCLPIVYQHVILGRFRIQSIYKIFQEGHLLLMFRCVYLLLKDKIQSFINKKNV